MSINANENLKYISSENERCLEQNEGFCRDDVSLTKEELWGAYQKLKEANVKLLKTNEIQEQKINNLQIINKEQLEFSKQAYIPFCCINEKGFIKEWNNAIADITGIAEEIVMDKYFYSFFDQFISDGEQFEHFVKCKNEILNTDKKIAKGLNMEAEITNQSTLEVVYVRFLLQPIHSQFNKFCSVLFQDITKEKRQEKELELYSEQLENILAENSAHLFHLTKYVEDIRNNTSDLTVQIEIISDSGAFKIISLNDAAKQFYNIKSITDEEFYDIYDFLPGVLNTDVGNFEEVGNGVRFRSNSKDGTRHWDTFLYSISNNDNVSRFLFISREITDQIEKERLTFVLKTSVNSWSSPYWICDDRRGVVVQNIACKEVWGDRIGQRFDCDFFPDKVRDKVKRGVLKVYQGEVFELQYKVYYKDDSYRYVIIKLTPMKTDCGKIRGFSGILYDVTERRELEQKVLNSVIITEEKERQYFAQELHDSVNPLLSAAGMYVDWLDKPQKNISQEEIVGDLKKLINEAYTTSREISHGLSPHMLKQNGLDGAIKIYGDRIQKSSSIQIEVNSNLINRPEEFIETAIYRVLCECILNSVKHSEAKKITVNINSDQDDIIILYFDDGKGFDINKEMESKKGIGLLSIKNRIDYINGTVSINSLPGEGFRMEIIICNCCK